MRIICRSPVRVNLANGGDTDYYVEQIGWGCIISVTLSSHFYEFEINDEGEAKIDIVDYFNPSNLNRTHFLESNVSELDLLKATLNYLNLPFDNSFILRTNVPMQSGLGGSSSLNVAMFASMLKFKEQKFTPHKIAEMSYDLERNCLNVPGGYQDQFAAAYGGGFNYMEFKEGKVGVENLNLPEETIKKLENNILIYFLQNREVSGSEVHNCQKKEAEKNPELIKKLLIEKRVNAMNIKKALQEGRLDDFGRLLQKEGEIKNKMTGEKGCSFAKDLMQQALDTGALGCKISGAGGGGCVLFYVPNDKINKVKEVLSNAGALEMRFRFQRQHELGIMLKGDLR